nr:immunoglobulin heavy chain junction region [Mus musculus]MBK4185040.1 immunoglobulin heavy chain junction region [Mus musculus]
CTKGAATGTDYAMDYW